MGRQLDTGRFGSKSHVFLRTNVSHETFRRLYLPEKRGMLLVCGNALTCGGGVGRQAERLGRARSSSVRRPPRSTLSFSRVLPAASPLPPLAPLLPPPLTEGRPFATLPSCHSRQRLLAPTQVSPPPPRARRLTRGRPLRLLAGEPLHLLARVRSRAGAPRLLARGRPLCPLVRRRFPCRLACVLLVMGVFRPVGRGAAVGGGWGAVRLARLRIWKS